MRFIRTAVESVGKMEKLSLMKMGEKRQLCMRHYTSSRQAANHILRFLCLVLSVLINSGFLLN